MFSFTYYQIRKLKVLMLASMDKLGYTSIQYKQAAIKRGITKDEAAFFYEDVMEEVSNASRPRKVVEAFLPSLFRLKSWNPLRLDASTYSSIEELVRDLEEFNNFPVDSSLQSNR